MNLLTVKNLNQSYGSKRVLRDLSLKIDKGEIIALIGPNGAGKTTFLQVMAGLLRPLSGFIVWPDGVRSLGLFLADKFLYEDLTVRENLRLFSSLYDVEELRCQSLMDHLKLDSFENQPVKTLSHGQKVRVGLARTFLVDASLYLLDEPFGGLDDQTARQVLSLIEREKGIGKTFIVATHEKELVSPLITRWISLEDGRLR